MNNLQDLYTKINELLTASGKDIRLAFLDLDPLDSGKISAVQFKHLLMNLKLGLSTKEIQTIVMLNNPYSNDQIDWHGFTQKLRL